LFLIFRAFSPSSLIKIGILGCVGSKSTEKPLFLSASEAIRQNAMKKTKFAVLSRGISGIRGRALIINLPGNPNAVRDSFEVFKDVLSHAIFLIKGKVKDCQNSLHLQHSHS
jgi:hypothetical protein